MFLFRRPLEADSRAENYGINNLQLRLEGQNIIT